MVLTEKETEVMEDIVKAYLSMYPIAKGSGKVKYSYSNSRNIKISTSAFGMEVINPKTRKVIAGEHSGTKIPECLLNYDDEEQTVLYQKIYEIIAKKEEYSGTISIDVSRDDAYFNGDSTTKAYIVTPTLIKNSRLFEAQSYTYFSSRGTVDNIASLALDYIYKSIKPTEETLESFRSFIDKTRDELAKQFGELSKESFKKREEQLKKLKSLLPSDKMTRYRRALCFSDISTYSLKVCFEKSEFVAELKNKKNDTETLLKCDFEDTPDGVKFTQKGCNLEKDLENAILVLDSQKQIANDMDKFDKAFDKFESNLPIRKAFQLEDDKLAVTLTVSPKGPLGMSFSKTYTIAESTSKKILKDFVKAYDKKVKERNDARLSRFEGFVGSGSLLYKAIAEVVEQNESYITANAVTEILKGHKVKLNTSIKDTPHSGKFAYLDEDDIKDAIDDLVEMDVFYLRELKGTYGRFDIIKKGSEFSVFEQAWDKVKHKKKTEYSDIEIVGFIEKEKDEALTVSKFKSRLFVFDHPAVFYYYPELFAKFLSGAPEEIKEYLRILAKMENKRAKKAYYNSLVEMISRNTNNTDNTENTDNEDL